MKRLAILATSILAALAIAAQAEATCFSGYQLELDGPYAHAADEVVGLAGADDKLFAVTRDSEIWARNAFATSANPRSAGPYNLTWRRNGSAYDVVAMTATTDRLFAVTSDDKLWTRVLATDASWEFSGYAPDAVALAATNGRLYAATTDGKLWTRAAVTTGASWRLIGSARDMVAMAAFGNRLFAASNDGRLLALDLPDLLPTGEGPVRSSSWKHIGSAYGVVALATVRNALFAVTGSNELMTREAVPSKADWRRVPDLVFAQGTGQVLAITATISASASSSATACNLYALSRITGVTLSFGGAPAVVAPSSADKVVFKGGGTYDYTLTVRVGPGAASDGEIEFRHDTRDPREHYEDMPLLGALYVQIRPSPVAP